MGLDLGAKTPGEIALAVVAEMIAVRRGAPRQERVFAMNRKSEETRAATRAALSAGGRT